MVGRPARTLEHFAHVVRAVRDHVIGRDRGDLRSGKFRPAFLAEIAERQQLQAVTPLANVVIDLEAALELTGIVLAEHACERPWLCGGATSWSPSA